MIVIVMESTTVEYNRKHFQSFAGLCSPLRYMCSYVHVYSYCVWFSGVYRHSRQLVNVCTWSVYECVYTYEPSTLPVVWPFICSPTRGMLLVDGIPLWLVWFCRLFGGVENVVHHIHIEWSKSSLLKWNRKLTKEFGKKNPR